MWWRMRPGIIPARAGFTLGEARNALRFIGSSPLARGLRRCHRTHRERGGIIPARAGFTASTRSTPSAVPDHPRSRGVYSSAACLAPSEGGSSPLARGLRRRGRPPVPRRGIIPARAGFTTVTSTRFEASIGSSPLARGLRMDHLRRGRAGRIIPARAGFTSQDEEPSSPGRDHPRSRGVYALSTQRRRTSRGSSPLARGLRRSPSCAVSAPRIIPARAGFTPTSPHLPTLTPDHPRSRGVYPRGCRPPPASRDHPRSRGVYGQSSDP